MWTTAVTCYLRVSQVMHLTEKMKKSRLYIACNAAIIYTLKLFSEKLYSRSVCKYSTLMI